MFNRAYPRRFAAQVLRRPSSRLNERVRVFGGVFCVQVIDSDQYEVIYVSPRNYFVFTPMLAAASVGTVDVRSITEPIRMANPCVKYVSGEVIEVVPGEKKVFAARRYSM